MSHQEEIGLEDTSDNVELDLSANVNLSQKQGQAGIGLFLVVTFPKDLLNTLLS